jgi:molecular chaperone DnaK
MPQIEVTFDIDANGILNVTAKDKGTSKEQKIRIESSSGLSKDEVEKMRRDAEAHAGEDKARRELVELKNQADHVAYETDKQLKEHGDKLEAGDKEALEQALAALRTAAQGEDKAALENALKELQTRAQKLGEVLYKQQAAAQGAQGAQGATGAGPDQANGPEEPAAAGKGGGDEPVDADFEVKT